VLLNIFPENQRWVKPGNAVKIIPETAPEKTFRGRIDFIEPVFRTDRKSLTARVYFNNAGLQIPIGSQVRATIFPEPETGDWLPQSAILSLGFDKVVFIRVAGGFRSHKVESGMDWGNMVQVLSVKTEDSCSKCAVLATVRIYKINKQPGNIY
jgi:Cu(I)/Ag(I) efflux system membrane fusion protein